LVFGCRTHIDTDFSGSYRFVRDIESASLRLDNPSENTTVLAPLNSAIEKLPRKPWEDPRDYGALGPNAYEGDDGQDRALNNLRRFVEAHMIPMSPWPAGKKVKAVGTDREVWWEDKGGVKVVRNANLAFKMLLPLICGQIQPGAIEIVSSASAVANGEVVCLFSRSFSLEFDIRARTDYFDLSTVDFKSCAELCLTDNMIWGWNLCHIFKRLDEVLRM
jgi:hypothetical protein